MEKKLCIASLSVSGVLLILFLLDLIIHIPFGGSPDFTMIDIVGILAGGILTYLSWNATAGCDVTCFNVEQASRLLIQQAGGTPALRQSCQRR